MSDHILKWRIAADDRAHVITGYKALHVACQDPTNPGTIHVWALAAEGKQDTLVVQTFPTGKEVPEEAEYIGTAAGAGGALMWHVFEVSKVVSENATYARPNRKKARNR